jgi:hypothetical protein
MDLVIFQLFSVDNLYALVDWRSASCALLYHVGACNAIVAMSARQENHSAFLVHTDDTGNIAVGIDWQHRFV